MTAYVERCELSCALMLPGKSTQPPLILSYDTQPSALENITVSILVYSIALLIVQCNTKYTFVIKEH